MHYMEAEKNRREKARWELHKNASNYIEQILKATPSYLPSQNPPK